MIAVLRPDLADDDWKKWRENAQQAMDQLVNQYKLGEEVELQEAVYQEAKPFLLKLTRGKCAYCESRIEINQPGDVEHYRPKGSVAESPDHPGYWWLASDWDNMLTSCANCNRVRSHAGERAGKGNRFPLADEAKRAFTPGAEVDEDPLLLNPCLDSPEQVLVSNVQLEVQPIVVDLPR